jgi:hypothetical protein
VIPDAFQIEENMLKHSKVQLLVFYNSSLVYSQKRLDPPEKSLQIMKFAGSQKAASKVV